MLKESFKTVDGDGNEITLAVLSPNAQIKKGAKLAYAKMWNEALQGGAMLIAKLDSHLRKQELWDDVRENDYQRLRTVLQEGEDKLRGGNIRLGEAKLVALQMAAARNEIAELLSVRNGIEANTAEKIAETHYFNYLVSQCTVYDDTGKRYFAGLDDYIERGEEIASYTAASKFAELFYGTSADLLAKLPENEFLRTYGFVNENYQLVDKQGRLVDEQGRLINEEGRFVNEDNELVNAAGERVDETGRKEIKFQPFLDDDTGLPVVEGDASPATED